MAVIRINKTSDYTIMSNNHFKEREMSLKAKGLLSLMLSLPDNWDYSIAGLVAICKENEKAITTALNELKKFGYLVIAKKMANETESGRIEYEYNIYEHPYFEKLPPHFLGLENVGAENLGVEKAGQLNTKGFNIKELNPKEKKKERKPTSYDAILTTIEDDSLRDLYLEYIKMRKLIKSPLTDRALTMLINKVNELEPDSIDRQKLLLEQAIINNWKSVYPLKDEKPEAKDTKRYGGTYL